MNAPLERPAASQRPRPRHRLLQLLMRVVLRPVFGWRDPVPYDGGTLRVPVDDGSELSVAVSEAAPGGVPPKGVVLLCHPFLKYGKRYFWRHGYPAWLNAAGYHAVAFDFRGFGGSRLAGIAFPDDIGAMADWAAARYPGLPLHLFGVSFGAYQGVHGLVRDLGRGGGRRRFRSAVFDSMPARLDRLFARGVTGRVMRWVSTSRLGPMTGGNTVLDSLPALGGLPCLVLYGRDDPFISADEITRVGRLCPGAKVTVFDDCGHLGLRKCHPDAYADAILRFIEQERS